MTATRRIYSDECHFCGSAIPKEHKNTYHLEEGDLLQPACEPCYDKLAATDTKTREKNSMSMSLSDLMRVQYAARQIDKVLKETPAMFKTTDEEILASYHKSLEQAREYVQVIESNLQPAARYLADRTNVKVDFERGSIISGGTA